MTQPSAALRLTGITKRFGATLALNDVRFDLRAGEVIRRLRTLLAR